MMGTGTVPVQRECKQDGRDPNPLIDGDIEPVRSKVIYWSFHNLGDISLFKMKVMFYILWYAPGWEDITAQYIGRDALSCYRSAPSRKRCRGDREAARCTLGQCITLAYKMAPGWREGS